MSAEEARLEDAPSIEWPRPDLSILDNQREPVPTVPIELLPQPWAAWIAEMDAIFGAPADYILQSVLAAVASLCGAAVRVRVTPSWDEPLVLWTAAVGEAASGKSTALEPMRRLLSLARPDGNVPAAILSANANPASLANIAVENARGVLLWRDGPRTWLGDTRGDGDRAFWLAAWMADTVSVARAREPDRSVARFAVSVLETMRPDSLKSALQSGDDNLATRFLFAWPGSQSYRALVAHTSVHDAEILQRLKAMSRLGESVDKPWEFSFDETTRSILDEVSMRLHAERLKVEGLEAAWLGRSRTFIARLAGLLLVMASVDGRIAPPKAVGRTFVECAAKLWLEYYWPHARAVFDSAGLTSFQRQVRRAGRWLCDAGAGVVSREDIRRRALSMSVTAADADQVLKRLGELGFVKADEVLRDGPGRPATRWRVNPALGSK